MILMYSSAFQDVVIALKSSYLATTYSTVLPVSFPQTVFNLSHDS